MKVIIKLIPTQLINRSPFFYCSTPSMFLSATIYFAINISFSFLFLVCLFLLQKFQICTHPNFWLLLFSFSLLLSLSNSFVFLLPFFELQVALNSYIFLPNLGSPYMAMTSQHFLAPNSKGIMFFVVVPHQINLITI